MRALLAASLAALAACNTIADREKRDRAASSDFDSDFARSQRSAGESDTLSSLAAIQRSLGDYVRHEGRIPDRLEQLIPKYLAEIPAADTGRHRPSSRVTYYPPTILRDGAVDGALLKDTGGWGYAHNDRLVMIFIDCVHPDSSGRPWYQELGASQWQPAP